MNSKKEQDEKMDKWKERFNELVNSAQLEIKKTAEIGKKMLSASKTNTSLADCYQTLGKLIYKDYKNNKLELDSTKAKTIIESIDTLTSQLNDYEEDVQELKKPSRPNSTRP